MIRARGVGVRIDRRWIVHDVSLDVERGEVLGVVGPNAAGKSTLLAALTGERRADRGRIEVAGRALGSLRPVELARRRAVVRQRSDVAFDLRVLDVVLLGRFAHEGRGDAPEDYEAARAALDEVDLGHAAERPYARLSGGEQRRVQIARALAQIGRGGAARGGECVHTGVHACVHTVDEGQLLLLDEPLANLDLHHQLDVLALLRRRAREGLAVLLVMHEIALAARACDRLLVLDEGRVAAEGAPREVLTRELFSRVFRVEAEIRADPRIGLAVEVLGAIR